MYKVVFVSMLRDAWHKLNSCLMTHTHTHTHTILLYTLSLPWMLDRIHLLQIRIQFALGWWIAFHRALLSVTTSSHSGISVRFLLMTSTHHKQLSPSQHPLLFCQSAPYIAVASVADCLASSEPLEPLEWYCFKKIRGEQFTQSIETQAVVRSTGEQQPGTHFLYDLVCSLDLIDCALSLLEAKL